MDLFQPEHRVVVLRLNRFLSFNSLSVRFFEMIPHRFQLLPFELLIAYFFTTDAFWNSFFSGWNLPVDALSAKKRAV